MADVALERSIPAARRRRRAGRRFAWLEPWTYLSPALALLALLMLVPLVVGMSDAFQQLQLLNPFKRGWVGFANLEAVFRDPVFWNALGNTVEWTFASLLLQFALGFGLALLLREPFAGRRVVQALVFVPWAVPSFLSGLTFAWLFNPVIGPLPHWLAALGILAAPDNILGDPRLALWGPIVANVWWGIPFFAITLLAALQAIPDEMYEASAIDGAGAWGRFRHVTIPYLTPTIAITLLLRTIWIANFGDLVWVMTGGGPANSTQILPTYIFTMAFRKLDFGYASALAMVLLALLLIYAVLLLEARKRLRSAA
ncbi:MAG: carbohydrate ABC transporter permease [Geminicoccaceae bacterium]